MNLGRIFKQTQSNRVNRRITPSLVEESTSAVQVLEVCLVLVTPEEIQVTDFKVRPEVAGGVTISILGVVRPQLVIRQPFHHVVIGDVGGVRGNELLGLRPELRDTLRRIEQVDGETVCGVAVLHVPENIIVDIAEVLDLRLHTPVVAVVLEDRVLVKHATVPAAHQVVGHLVTVLDALLLQHLRRFVEKVHVDPIGNRPVVLGDFL